MLAPNLEQTLHRSLAYANERRHDHATLEHLLLALTEDPDAIATLVACRVDIPRLRRSLIEYIDNDLKSLIVNRQEDARPTPQFQLVLQRSAIHVQSSGRKELTGANVLVAMFSQRESPAVLMLEEQDMTRLDAVNHIAHGFAKTSKTDASRRIRSAIRARERADKQPKHEKTIAIFRRDIEGSASNAPTFEPIRGRIRFRERSTKSSSFRERKDLTSERCAELQNLCAKRGNELPEFKRLVDLYSSCLKALRRDRGAYRVHLAALDIETFMNIQARITPDDDRNRPLDSDVLFSAQSLVIAHATLITLFP